MSGIDQGERRFHAMPSVAGLQLTFFQCFERLFHFQHITIAVTEMVVVVIGRLSLRLFFLITNLPF